MSQYLLENIIKQYDSPSEPTCVLHKINLSIAHGESLAIVGASGSGKSTLLHILGALDIPSSGTVLFNNKNLSHMTPNEKACFRNKLLGFIFQFHNLLPEFSAEENVAMKALIAGIPKKKALLLAREALGSVGLENKYHHRITMLSGGERQRVAIARAILLEPQVLLADEPTGNLDQKTGEHIANLLNSLNKTFNITLIVVTHNNDIAHSMGRCLELKSGDLHDKTPEYISSTVTV